MEAYIYDIVRTPRGRSGRGGSLREISPVTLAATVLRALRDRNGLDTRRVDDVCLGCVLPIGEQGQDIARTAVLMAGFDIAVPGVQLHRYCASGLDACMSSAAQIACGQNNLAIAGGVESMSWVPINGDGGAIHTNPEVATYTGFSPQGVGADVLATLNGFTRENVDAYAVESHRRASHAWDEGRFTRSVVPVFDGNGLQVLDVDEAIRRDTSIASMASLKPSFKGTGEIDGFDTVCQLRYPQMEKVNHVHHAGNSSAIVDGASGVLIGSKAISSEIGIRPRARIRAYANIGSDPTIMLTGPVPATKRALQRAGMKLNDIDLFEVNEAFASVPLSYMRELDISAERVNVNGGSIAMGHPLGATGAILMGTLLDELERRNLSTGLITLCVGAGMGIATIIERV